MSWATHRLNGVSNHISATYTVPELTYQLEKVRPLALFTCLPLLGQALEAVAAVGLPKECVFLLPVPHTGLDLAAVPANNLTVDELVAEGSHLAPLPRQIWESGQGARQTAFLCNSSGTSGLPVSFLSHRHALFYFSETFFCS